VERKASRNGWERSDLPALSGDPGGRRFVRIEKTLTLSRTGKLDLRPAPAALAAGR